MKKGTQACETQHKENSDGEIAEKSQNKLHISYSILYKLYKPHHSILARLLPRDSVRGIQFRRRSLIRRQLRH